MFKIPVVLFIFKRKDTLVRIIKRIKEVKPEKIYLLSDYGRNDEEIFQVKEVRKYIESLIDWDCEVEKKYSNENIGVYKNIGEGAKWVFEREEKAIFLEDDNLPEITFFRYCEELLKKYEKNKDIFWICGTNYMEEYNSIKNESYFFTRHMLPCGWASWSKKFINYYDGMLESQELKKDLIKMRKTYVLKNLYFQEKSSIMKTKYQLLNEIEKASWDSQILFTVRKNKFYGICPSKNLIENIGVDKMSTHGGDSFNKVMTKRFCGMKSKGLDFPLRHPIKIEINNDFERKIAKIRLYPLKTRIKIKLAYFIKPLLGLNRYESFINSKFYLKNK